MGRSVDEAKWRTWAERLDRFNRLDVTVSGFCGAEGVSVASFYQWRAKLAQRRPCSSGQAEPSSTGPSFRELELSVTGRACVATLRMPNGVEVELHDHPSALELLREALLIEVGPC